MKKTAVFRTLRTVWLVLSVVCLILAVIFLQIMVINKGKKTEDPAFQYVEDVRHRVLLFCSYNSQYYTYANQIEGFHDSLYPNGVEYDVIFMDAKNYRTSEDQSAFYNFFVSRMENGKKYDGVIAVDDEALEFMCDYGKKIFGDIPIVFIGANNLTLAKKACTRSNITGFYENDYLEETLKLTRKIFPNRTKYVGFFDESAAGKTDGARFTIIMSRLTGYEFETINVTNYTKEQLIEVIKQVPDDAIIIYMTCFSDADGITHTKYEMTNFFKEYSNAPIVRCYEDAVGDGVLGSIGMSFYQQAKNAGETMVKVLDGADISRIHMALKTPSITEFDYNVMARYGITEKMLPEETIIINKPVSFIDVYGAILPSAGLIFLAMIMLLQSVNATVFLGRESNRELLASKEELEKSQKRLIYQAEHDDFLDILNRRTAVEYLRRHAIPDKVFSIIMVDIDNFKDVNETYGHQVADEVLKHLSYELENLAKTRDWMLARYGGDEFLMMLSGERVTEDSSTIQEIMKIFRNPISMGDETIIMSCSMGVSLSDGVTTPDQHIINAEIAMYEAKQRGRNKAFLYSDDMKKKVREENKVKAKILDAMDNDGFYMVYQPQINTETKKLCGFEALVRMKAEGMYPGVFIPIAEASGWIARIGRITTELVIKQLAAWRDAGYMLYPVSINYSSNQLSDIGYVEFLKELLEEYNISGQFVEIEVTESLFLEKTEKAESLFAQLKALGIKILMDDFGTGYSSLGYLTYIPVDVVKLDKSLVDAYLVGGKDSFIRDVIQLVHDLDKLMIIEGVEEKWQYEKLREFKADIIQGYYFSKPISPEEAIVFDVSDK
ncbi:ABC transporter substrate binding protein [Butyrivibrio sp. AE3006]|uniref:ABC transporter substrate binding protein n=1 Tax=Butyrivibrio sp. AE3006 TaxID=1280673 RepID=UPI0004183138|nr:ABC transporter substrate binding protein [Butyrivibrio sp. AE3006]